MIQLMIFQCFRGKCNGANAPAPIFYVFRVYDICKVFFWNESRFEPLLLFSTTTTTKKVLRRSKIRVDIWQKKTPPYLNICPWYIAIIHRRAGEDLYS